MCVCVWIGGHTTFRAFWANDVEHGFVEGQNCAIAHRCWSIVGDPSQIGAGFKNLAATLCRSELVPNGRPARMFTVIVVFKSIGYSL